MARLFDESKCIPGLGVVIVGERMDSLLYVAKKVSTSLLLI